jgi:hypothetical protein
MMPDGTRELWVAGVAFAAGFIFCWAYLNACGLVRTRREYYAARRAEGHEVPEDWEDDG